MSAVTFTEAADRVKSSLDIVDVVQRYVMLKKTGRNYTGKCPFHNDKNPSMSVHREKNLFKCFSCGAGGDAIAFLMRRENKTYGELIRDLAQEQGIEIQQDGQSKETAAQNRDAKTKILDLNEAAARWFEQRLFETTPAAESVRTYLRNRQTPETVMKDFQLGYAPEGWENLTSYLKAKFDFVQSNPDLLITAGLSNSRDHGQGHYDRFRHRLIIPIHDEKGQVVAFGGRALKNQSGEEDKPKYLNSPETLLYKKNQVLYGFHRAKETIREPKTAIVMEGYFDVISAHAAGITQAVGSCGTALTENHLKLLNRFGTETVYLAFDSDEAGLKAALSAIQLMEPYMETISLQLKVIIVPNGKDPDEFIRLQGAAAFRELMATARGFLDFKLDMAIQHIALETAEGRIEAANRLTPALAAIIKPTVRAEYLRKYAERLHVSEEALLLEVKRYEQRKNPPLYTKYDNSKNFSGKKAISKRGSTSLKRNKPMLTDNMSELRIPLTSRQLDAEKNLLRLLLLNVESYSIMLAHLSQPDDNVIFSLPQHQRILEDLRRCAQAGGTDSLGTLIDKMNHEYIEYPELQQILAELVITAEPFADSLGLGDLSPTHFQEKLIDLADEHIAQLRSRQHQQQLRALNQQPPADEIELQYQLREQLRAKLERNQK